MAILRQGSSGDDVSALQKRLAALGLLDPQKDVDGVFGAKTQQAVKDFQQKSNLTPVDGIVGPATAAALELDAPADGADASTGGADQGAAGVVAQGAAAPPAFDVASVTVSLVSKMFPGTPVANITTNLPFVLQALQDAGLADEDMVLMGLATIRAETASFRPISEGKSKYNTAPGGTPFGLYDPPNRVARNLGNTQVGDGPKFKGRGFIQLTGRDNYTTFGPVVGADLVNNPDLGNDPKTAADLLAAFLKRHEARIRADLAKTPPDLKDARKAVNGGSNGLPEFSEAFKTGKALLA